MMSFFYERLSVVSMSVIGEMMIFNYDADQVHRSKILILLEFSDYMHSFRSYTQYLCSLETTAHHALRTFRYLHCRLPPPSLGRHPLASACSREIALKTTIWTDCASCIMIRYS